MTGSSSSDQLQLCSKNKKEPHFSLELQLSSSHSATHSLPRAKWQILFQTNFTCPPATPGPIPIHPERRATHEMLQCDDNRETEQDSSLQIQIQLSAPQLSPSPTQRSKGSEYHLLPSHPAFASAALPTLRLGFPHCTLGWGLQNQSVLPPCQPGR